MKNAPVAVAATIRTDESGQPGTTLTISQLVSVVVLATCVVVWLARTRLPRIDAKPASA